MNAVLLEPATFAPAISLVPGLVRAGCTACVTIPARNEEGTLRDCLNAFTRQVDPRGMPLRAGSFEILLLLNNCTDSSATIAEQWRAEHPKVALHIVERQFSADQAHAGTARRLLMDTAWQRLGGEHALDIARVLATDADSVVADDWIAQNLAAMQAGADAVGGAIQLRGEELRVLPAQARECYLRDRRYAELVAQVEDLLDPQAGDPWPRHLDHFGSSLACTARAYGRAGGMPAVAALEDEAFVDRLRRADLCLRHEPLVRVFTSARLEGRARVGLAGQLRLWHELEGHKAHFVQSAAYLTHRFKTLQRLRKAFATGTTSALAGTDTSELKAVVRALNTAESVPAFLAAVDCDGLIERSFKGEREEPILQAIAALEAAVAAS